MGTACTNTVGPLGDNTTLLCSLVERCGCPCVTKIVEMPGQFILYIHAEHTAADHATDHAKFLTQNKQN